jgi:hypothetical protein
MNTKIRPGKPLSIMLIAGFYIFGAVVLLISMFINSPEISERIAEVHGISLIIGNGILPAIAVLALIISYGLFSLSKWGYALTLTYVLYTGVIGLIRGGLGFAVTGEASLQVYFGSILWSALVVICLIATRRQFFRPKASGLSQTAHQVPEGGMRRP